MATLRTKNRMLLLGASLGTASLVLTGCGAGSSGGGEGGSEAGEFSFLTNVENTTISTELETLASDQCKTAADAMPLKVDTVPQTNLDQQLQLLAGQGALPVQFAAGNAPALTKELAGSGNVLDLEATLTDLDVIDQIEPAAIDTIKALYGGFNVLPYQYNVEGVWYNKQLFAENNIEVPQSWDDFVAASESLKQSGVTPLSASGEQGWPLTRLISGYLFSDLGKDALQKVADGEAKLTDPEYVEAAAQVASLGEKGYFGEGVGSIDYDTAINQFLTGEAGMLYMGSWVLANFNDEAANQIGLDNIGFMPFPKVEGGSGVDNQYAANVGLPMAISQKAYNEGTGEWLKCISENYGSSALGNQGSISGFKVNEEVDVDPLTQTVQETISSTSESVLWFEALFDTQATTASQTNAAPLVTGSMSPEQFMETVQSALK
ncbi:ABC transporter substrate-binding protein [Arthrobacter sp. B0490]|uniref:ABC transporter substrate-binding protein n=1 Tax=Arthrobacter sp. B0490 TaxID=2058891 RepID=UPI0021587A93|nr:extracellular solute-binding protein [Arthrobacter sp. B0490]